MLAVSAHLVQKLKAVCAYFFEAIQTQHVVLPLMGFLKVIEPTYIKYIDSEQILISNWRFYPIYNFELLVFL